MNLTELYRQIFCEPSLIEAAAHASIRQVFRARLMAADPQAAQRTAMFCGEAVDLESMEIKNGIAYIPIGGAIGQKLGDYSKIRGAVDVADIETDIAEAEADPRVRAMVFDMDSPGGMVSGTPELADRIAGRTKPIYTFSNGMIASAAYWIASATDGIFTTKTANIGSIGVYVPHYDETQAYANEGVTVELIKSGKLKGIGFPGIPLSDAGREHLQERVNEIGAMFKAHVRSRRQGVADSTMEGQTFMAPAALKLGLINAIVRSRADVAAML